MTFAPSQRGRLEGRQVFLAALCSLIIGFIIWRPLPLFFTPGLLLLFFDWKTEHTATFFINILYSSLSYWIISFWWLKYLPIALTTLYYTTLALTALALVIGSAFLPRQTKFTISGQDLITICTFFAVGAFRFAPMVTALVPSGADMSMHAYIAALIAHANGIPASYEPILNIQHFDTFPVGFHAITALIALSGEIELYRASFIMTCFSYAALTLALFSLLKTCFDWLPSLVTALCCSFLTRDPQRFVCWGGNPTIFALTFIIVLIPLFAKLESSPLRNTLLAASLVCAVFLTHTVVFVQSAYILSFSLLAAGLVTKRFNKTNVTLLLVVAALIFLLATPYLLNLNNRLVTDYTLDWIKNWVRNTEHAWQGSVANCLWTIPSYVRQRLLTRNLSGIMLQLMACYGALVLVKKNLQALSFCLAFLLGCGLLIANARYWSLPFSSAIYPERVAVMIIIPLSVLVAAGLTDVSMKVARLHFFNQVSMRRITVALLLLALAVSSFQHGCRFYATCISKLAAVSSDDLKAILWLKANTPSTALVENNYGDAGAWIPAIAERPVTDPHINVVYLDKCQKPAENASYVFIGAKCIYSESCPRQAADFASNASYRLLFNANNAYVFQKLKVLP